METLLFSGPILTVKHHTTQLNFAHEYQKWLRRRWRPVYWFTVSANDRQVRVWSCQGEWYVLDKGIPVMDRPARSPDLTPVEHVWGMLCRCVRGREYTSENVQSRMNCLVSTYSTNQPILLGHIRTRRNLQVDQHT